MITAMENLLAYYIDNFISNIKEKKTIKIGRKKTHFHIQKHPFRHICASLFLLCTSNQPIKTSIFNRIIQWSFLPSLVPIGPVVSEKIKNRQHPFWLLWASCFFCCLLLINKNSIFLEGNSIKCLTIISSNWPSGFRTDNAIFDALGPLISFVYFRSTTIFFF